MSLDEKFSFSVRSLDSFDELVIVFCATNCPDELERELMLIFDEAGLKFLKTYDFWINDEVLFKFSSVNGTVILSRDNWDLFCINAEYDRSDIRKIDELLQLSPRFSKLD